MRKENKKRLKGFIMLSLLGLIFLNFTLISGYMILQKYGDITLGPGEKYTMNIPFIGQSKNPQICGTAIQTDDELIEGINVSVFFSSNDDFAGSDITDSNGKYCITLPEITTRRNFDIYVEYDNDTLQLASNDYELRLNNNLNYVRGLNNYAVLTGEIINQDARIDNGKFEVNLKYYGENSSQGEEIFDYKKYYINMEPNEVFTIPNNELNVSWKIPDDARTGKYKFYVKTSFNAKDKTSTINFNLS